MKKEKKPGSFIKPPQYPGGKTALLKFVKENIKYPAAAAKEMLKGTVHLEYKVNAKGKVSSVKIKNGIGHGCDAEAIRVVKMLEYKPQKNRNLKVHSRKTIRIKFEPPKEIKKVKRIKMEPNAVKRSIQPTSYSYVITPKVTVKEESTKDEKSRTVKKRVYTYKIKIK